MQRQYIEQGRRLLALPGVQLQFEAQFDVFAEEPYDEDRGTRFEPCALDAPEATSFTHYLRCSGDLSPADEGCLSYYNAESWGESTDTLDEQIRLVRERFPDLDLHIVAGG